MCKKCTELDRKIEHYQRLTSSIIDQRTIDGIDQLIKNMEAEKARLHGEPNK
jgi:hypothetical protein